MTTTMQMSVCALCFVLGMAVSPAGATSESLKNLELQIVNVEHSGSITVRIANSSHQKHLRVWTEANSWGALRWRVLIIRKGRVHTIFENGDGVGFAKNTPQFDEIAIGSHIDRQLSVNGEYWSRAGGGQVHFDRGDQVIVIYDVPPEKRGQANACVVRGCRCIKGSEVVTLEGCW